MDRMRRAAVTQIQAGRERRLSRAVSARRRFDRAPFPARHRSDETDGRRTGGRAWVNGEELGGTDPRHSPLALSHD